METSDVMFTYEISQGLRDGLPQKLNPSNFCDPLAPAGDWNLWF